MVLIICMFIVTCLTFQWAVTMRFIQSVRRLCCYKRAVTIINSDLDEFWFFVVMICSFKYFPYHRIIVFVADKIFFKWGFYGHWCNYLGFLVYQLVTKAFKACGLPSFCWNEELAGNPITSFLFWHLICIILNDCHISSIL